jgi:hypothetical protein
VVLPPAKPPKPSSLLLTAPPRSPTNPYPNHPATATNTSASLWDSCC